MLTFFLADNAKGFAFLQRFARALSLVRIEYKVERTELKSSSLHSEKTGILDEDSSLGDITTFLLKHQ